MVQYLARSPLTWSIGGVGAIAIALIGFDYLHQPAEPGSNSDITLPSVAVSSPWQQGKTLGWQAAVAAQGAQTQADWQQVAALWEQAIAALDSIPETDTNFPQAEAKAEEYRSNRAIAIQRQAAARPSPSPVTGLADLRRALAATDPAFTFAPGPIPNSLVGRSADGLATVELAGSRATLVLPRSKEGKLTMAQVVYARQFLAIAAPETNPQPWLMESLGNVQSDRPLTIPHPTPVNLSAARDSLSITINASTINASP